MRSWRIEPRSPLILNTTIQIEMKSLEDPNKLGNWEEHTCIEGKIEKEEIVCVCVCVWKKLRIFLDPVSCCVRRNRI